MSKHDNNGGYSSKVSGGANRYNNNPAWQNIVNIIGIIFLTICGIVLVFGSLKSGSNYLHAILHLGELSAVYIVTGLFFLVKAVQVFIANNPAFLFNARATSAYDLIYMVVLFLALNFVQGVAIDKSAIAEGANQFTDWFEQQAYKGNELRYATSTTKHTTVKRPATHETTNSNTPFTVVNKEQWDKIGRIADSNGETGQQWCVRMWTNDLYKSNANYQTPDGQHNFLVNCGIVKD